MDAAVWVWAHARTQPDGSIYHYAFLDGGWRDDAQRSIGLAANHTPESAAIMAAMNREVAGHHTRIRTDFLDDGSWRANGLFEKFRKPADLDDFLFSYYPIGPNDVSNVGLHKAFGSTRRRLLFVAEFRWKSAGHRPNGGLDGGLQPLRARLVYCHNASGGR